MNFTINYRNNINDKFNLKNLAECKKLIEKNKLEFINKGIQGEVFKVFSSDCGSVIVKKRIIDEKEKKWKNNKQWITEEFETEYKIMLLTNRMIDKFICPNFIEAYDFDANNLLLTMEYADGDSSFLFKDEYQEEDIYKSYLCQVLIALYAFTNYTQLYHRDVKPKNIFYKKINQDIVLHYKINNNNY